MSQAIDALAFIGSNSEARNAAEVELAALLRAAGFEDGCGRMLLSADREWLERELGADPTICCLVHAPEEEEAPLEEEGPGEGGKEDEEGEDLPDGEHTDD